MALRRLAFWPSNLGDFCSRDAPVQRRRVEREVLGVSRPFLIRVLEAGEIPYRKAGRHRRVLMKDVLAYKQSMQVERRAALDELVKASEDMGGYDL